MTARRYQVRTYPGVTEQSVVSVDGKMPARPSPCWASHGTEHMDSSTGTQECSTRHLERYYPFNIEIKHMTLINRVQTDSYVYTITREPRPGSMAEWYANEFRARAVPHFSTKLDTVPLPQAYELLRLFGAFYPQWEA